jgi:hypothetical protein
MYNNYNDHSVLKLHASKQRDYEQLANRERLAKSLVKERGGFKCLVCEKLAGMLLALSQKLQEQAQVKPVDELPSLGT